MIFRIKMAKWRGAMAVMFMFSGVHSAFACSVCATATDEARYAYYGTTALLSLLPLCMVGGIIYYIIKKSR